MIIGVVIVGVVQFANSYSKPQLSALIRNEKYLLKVEALLANWKYLECNGPIREVFFTGIFSFHRGWSGMNSKLRLH